jgi:hypothetical protein
MHLLLAGDVGGSDISIGEVRPDLTLCGVRPGSPGLVRGVPTPRRDAFFGVMGMKSRSFRRSAKLGWALRGVRGGAQSGETERDEDVDVEASKDDGRGVAVRVLF